MAALGVFYEGAGSLICVGRNAKNQWRRVSELRRKRLPGSLPRVLLQQLYLLAGQRPGTHEEGGEGMDEC